MGVLRSIVDAHTLIETTQIKSSVILLGSVLMKGDGTIIIDSGESEAYDGLNLYDVLRDNGFADPTVEEMRANVENEHDVATVSIGQRDDKMLFFTSVRLNVNDWTIVNFTEENTIAEHSRSFCTTPCSPERRSSLSAPSPASWWRSSSAVFGVARCGEAESLRGARGVFRHGAVRVLLRRRRFGVDSQRPQRVCARQPATGALSGARNLKLVDFHEDDLPQIDEVFEHPSPPGETRESTVRVRVLTGEYRWFSITCRYLYEGYEPYAVVGKMVDITQQRALEEQLVRRSQIDGLTKALNKVTAEEKIAAALLQHDRGLLFMIDVDHFKQINDSCGHRVGDQALVAIAEALFDVFRRDDPVGRVGGDEFVAFAAGAEDADAIAAKRTALARPPEAIVTRDLGVPVSLSVGVARYPGDGTTYQELFDAADRAMYREKQDAPLTRGPAKGKAPGSLSNRGPWQCAAKRFAFPAR
ncbi:MAG: GGDEF domain-containing protein [Gordonibacter pamelaeae]